MQTGHTVTTGITNGSRLKAAGGTDVEKRNVASVREVLDAFSRSDFTLLRSKMAPGAGSWVVGFSPETMGANYGNPNFVPELFPNGMHFDIKQAAAEGNVVCVEWNDEAITSRGARYENTGCSWFTFDDEGRIVSYREYINPDNFFKVM